MELVQIYVLMESMVKFQVDNVLIVIFLALDVLDLLILSVKNVKLDTLIIMELVLIYVLMDSMVKVLVDNALIVTFLA